MKNKIMRIAAGFGVLGFALMAGGGLVANAQIFPYTGSSSVSAAPVITTTTTTATSSVAATTTATIATTTPTSTATATPIFVSVTGPTSGYIQFNHLVVSNVSSANTPATIIAGNTAGGTTNTFGEGTCLMFASQDSLVGTPVACPVFTNVASSTVSSTSAPAYTINVDASAQLLMSDHTVATLGNITAGDQINVFGYYNGPGDGSIQAMIVRDLSKPVGTLLPPATPLPGEVLGASTTATGTTAVSIQQIIAEIQQITAAINALSALIAGNTATTPSSTTASPMLVPTGGITATTTTSTTVPNIY